MEPNATPTAVSKAEYARAKNVERSTITRWAQANRIVLDPATGRVLVEESEARLALTADPDKAGVVDRHERERGQPVGDLATAGAAKQTKKRAHDESYGKRITESARREAAEADMAEWRRDQQGGKLTDVEGVNRAEADFSTFCRQIFERVPVEMRSHLTLPQYELLRKAVDAALRKVSETAQAQADLAANTRQ